MQIAKMFASLGFNVDTSGLDKFRQNLKQVRAEINNLGRDSKTASKKIRSLSSALDGLSTKLDRVSIKRANDNIAKSYQGVARSLGLVERALNSIQTNQKKITNALGKIHSSVKAGEPLWNRYSAAVRAARHELDLANIRLREIRANSDIRIRITKVGDLETEIEATVVETEAQVLVVVMVVDLLEDSSDQCSCCSYGRYSTCCWFWCKRNSATWS